MLQTKTINFKKIQRSANLGLGPEDNLMLTSDE